MSHSNQSREQISHSSELVQEITSLEEEEEIASLEEKEEITSLEEEEEIASLEEKEEITSLEEVEKITSLEEVVEITSLEEVEKITSLEEVEEITSRKEGEESSPVASHEEPTCIQISDDVMESPGDAMGDPGDVMGDPGDVMEDAADVWSETYDDGSAELDEDLPDITSDYGFEESPDVVSCERYVEELRQWVETEAEFYGRTDDEFLVMFLRGCKMNMDKTKKKMSMYYSNRKKLPLWWANRKISDVEDLLQMRMNVLLSDTDPNLPTITIVKYERFGNKPEAVDRIVALTTIILEMTLRRSNSQQNGTIYLVDCAGYPMWLITKLLNFSFLYNVIHSIFLATPMRLKGLYFVNFPFIARTIWQLSKTFIPKKMKERFHFYGSDWSALKDKIDVRLLPVEYGGSNGSLIDHEEAFIEEMHNFSEYLIDDNKYGFDKS